MAAGKPVKIAILADAREAVQGFDKAGAAAKDAGSKFDSVAEGADGVSSASSQAAGGIGDLGGALSMIPGPLGKLGSGMEAVAPAIMGVTGAADLMNLATSKFPALAKVAAGGSKVLALAQRALGVATRFALGPFGLVILAIGALVAIMVVAYKKSDTFRRIVDKSWAAIKKASVAVFGFLSKYLGKVWTAIKAVVTVQVRVISAVVRTVWNVVKTVTRVAWNLIKGFVINPVRALVSAVRERLAAARGFVTGAWDTVKTKTREAWQAVVAAIREKIGAFMQTVRGIKGRITGALSTIGSWLYSAGKDLIQGMINGIRAMASNLVGAARGVVDSAIKGAKNLLGINSPSRVFKDIGKYTVKGLAQGLGDSRGLGDVKRAAGRMTSAIGAGFESPSLTLNAAGAYGGVSASGGNTYQITVNVPVGASSADIGRELTRHIDAYERSGGRRRA